MNQGDPADDDGAYAYPETELDRLEASIATTRETLRWAMAAFGAIGAVVLAGLSLSGISAARDADLPLAAASAGIAIGGVMFSVVVAARVIAGSDLDLDDIVTPRRPSADRFLGNTNKAVHRRLARDEGLLQGRFASLADWHRALRAERGDDDAAVAGNAIAWELFDGTIGPVIRHAMQMARFRRALWLVCANLVVTAVAAAVYAHAIAVEPARATTEPGRRLTAVIVTPTDRGEELLADLVAATGCEIAEPAHLVGGPTDDPPTVLFTFAGDGCAPALVPFDEQLGDIVIVGGG